MSAPPARNPPHPPAPGPRSLELALRGARRAWAGAVAGGDGARRSELLRSLAREARRLRRPSDGPLGRVLAGAVALAAARVELAGRGSEPGRLSAARRELAAATRMLAAVRTAGEQK